MATDETILSGPEFTGEDFHGSFAEYLFPRMKSLPGDSIVQIDANTGESITAHDFLKLSVEIAEGLNKLGLESGDIVVLAVPNCIRSHATTVGTFFSGGVLSPFDQNLKTIELTHLLKQLGPKFVICEWHNRGKFWESAKSAGINAKIIFIDTQDSNSDYYTWNDMRTEVDLDNYVPRKVKDCKAELALIMCSSGSTGLPKGVALSHYALLRNNSTIVTSPDVEWIKSLLMCSPLFWISGIVLIMISCTCGQTRIIPKSSNPEDLLECVQTYKPMFVMATPAVILHMVEHPDFSKYDLESVKVVACGGAVLGRAPGQKIKDMWKGIVFFQSYGMTEVCGGITTGSPDQELESVGKPGMDVQMKVVDVDTGKSLGPNEVGECRLRTKRIMNGYYNNEEATKAAFDENGWLLTGDLVYYNEQGFIFVVGRIKEVITYRSYQISPAEIESFILGLPGVKDVAVIPVPHEEDDSHIKALVVKSAESKITAEDIIQAVKDNLADSKHLRGGVQFVDILPRTEVGKLKRGHLMHFIQKESK